MGLLIGTVGIDPLYGIPRFTFGVSHIESGINFTVVMIGLFAIGEVIDLLVKHVDLKRTFAPKPGTQITWSELWGLKGSILRGSGLGSMIGLIPGAGATVGAVIAYGVERQASGRGKEFGTGVEQALAAPEAAKNATTGAAMIPLLTLGIPGSGVAAVLMAALIIHGAQPGPLLMVTSPQTVYDIIAMLFIATMGILILGLGLTKVMVMILRVRDSYLMPVVATLCIVGPYAIQSRIFDIWVVVAFGVIGYGLRLLNYPMAPLVLGIVLGELLDRNLRRALVLADGDYWHFFTRPISAVIVVLIVLMVAAQIPWVRNRAGALKARLGRGAARTAP